MIDGKPEWVKLSGAALADVCLMDDAEKLRFVNELCLMWENAMNPDYQPEPAEGFIGRAITRQLSAFREGVSQYVKRANLNPSGLPKDNGTRTGTRTGTRMGTQNRTEQNRKDRRTEEIVEQTRQELNRSGYTEQEIDSAIDEVKSWEGVNNPAGLVISIIKNRRKGTYGKHVPAQDYGQRDYSEWAAGAADRFVEQYRQDHPDEFDKDGRFTGG